MPELAIETGDAAPAVFDFRLDRAARRAFLLLALGHLLFAAALTTVAASLGDYGLYLITPLFGLPLLVLGPRDRLAARALVLLFGFAAIHYGAAWLARTSYAVPFTDQGFTDSIPLCGAIGGLAGAAASFALCRLCGLLRPGSWPMALAGLATLTILGAVGLSIALVNMGDSAVGWLLFLYTPWQFAFAYFLAKTLRG